MKRFVMFFVVLVLPLAAFASGQVNIDLSVSGEVAPGVYGQVNIGNRQPAVVYEQPIIIKESRHVSRPLYLHVPPGHAKHWAQHCAEYNACDRQVYFVRSSEYNDYRNDEHDNRKEKHNGKHNNKGRHDDDDDREDGRDHDRGHGRN